MDKPKANPDTVDEIVNLCVQRCFDWAQGSIAETMAAVAAKLPEKAVDIKHEIMEEDLG
jgi:hypothetical protein